jgi:hypothetical protein
MTDNKDDKPGKDYPAINDSGELLKALFREELDAIRAEDREETVAKTSDKSGAPKKPNLANQGKGTRRGKVRPEMGTEEKRIAKRYPISEDEVSTQRKVASNRDTSIEEKVQEKTAPLVKDDTQEGLRPGEDIKTKQRKGGKVRFGGNLLRGSGKLKGALLSVLLVAAVAFMLSSLGVVDFGQLLGPSEPGGKASRKTSVARRPIAKKSSSVAPKSTQETMDNKAHDQGAVPERRRFVGIRSEAALSKARRRIIKRRSKAVTPTQEPSPVQERPEPSASTEKPVIAAQVPEPVASTQKEVVPEQPAESVSTEQESPVSKTPPEPVGPTHKPLVAKEPAEPSGPKVQTDVAKAASHSVEKIPEKAAPGKEIVFPGQRDPSYPYSIYLGSYKSLDRAERAVSEFRKRGLSPYWVKIDLGERGMWYRVFSGYFQEREQANAFIKKKRITESESRHTKYANLIGLFALQKQAEEEKLRLSKLGYCPYVIPGQNDESLLYVGAFYQEARAKRLCEELASKGIHSQIVQR